MKLGLQSAAVLIILSACGENGSTQNNQTAQVAEKATSSQYTPAEQAKICRPETMGEIWKDRAKPSGKLGNLTAYTVVLCNGTAPMREVVFASGTNAAKNRLLTEVVDGGKQVSSKQTFDPSSKTNVVTFNVSGLRCIASKPANGISPAKKVACVR